MAREQRSSQRLSIAAKVPVRMEEEASPIEALTRDISVDGVYVYMDAKVRDGSMLEIVLPLPGRPGTGAQWVRCRCKVRRVEETGPEQYGVAASIEEFESVPEAIVPE